MMRCANTLRFLCVSIHFVSIYCFLAEVDKKLCIHRKFDRISSSAPKLWDKVICFLIYMSLYGLPAHFHPSLTFIIPWRQCCSSWVAAQWDDLFDWAQRLDIYNTLVRNMGKGLELFPTGAITCLRIKQIAFFVMRCIWKTESIKWSETSTMLEDYICRRWAFDNYADDCPEL